MNPASLYGELLMCPSGHRWLLNGKDRRLTIEDEGGWLIDV